MKLGDGHWVLGCVVLLGQSRLGARGKQTERPQQHASSHHCTKSTSTRSSLPLHFLQSPTILITASKVAAKVAAESRRFSPAKARNSARLRRKAVVGRGGWFPASTIFST
jgi:hypothetical protein